MPLHDDDYFTITIEWLRSHGTSGIGFPRAQVTLLNVPYPLVSGWQERLVGQQIPVSVKERFEELHHERQTRLNSKLSKEIAKESLSQERKKGSSAEKARNKLHPHRNNEQSSPQSLEQVLEALAQRLVEILGKAERLTCNPSIFGWKKELLYLSKSTTIARVHDAIEWLAIHLNDEFVPLIWSASSFRKKFPRIEAAMRRCANRRAS